MSHPTTTHRRKNDESGPSCISGEFKSHTPHSELTPSNWTPVGATHLQRPPTSDCRSCWPLQCPNLSRKRSWRQPHDTPWRQRTPTTAPLHTTEATYACHGENHIRIPLVLKNGETQSAQQQNTVLGVETDESRRWHVREWTRNQCVKSRIKTVSDEWNVFLITW